MKDKKKNDYNPKNEEHKNEELKAMNAEPVELSDDDLSRVNGGMRCGPVEKIGF